MEMLKDYVKGTVFSRGTNRRGFGKCANAALSDEQVWHNKILSLYHIVYAYNVSKYEAG